MAHAIAADESGSISLDERQRTAIKAFVGACRKVREDVYGTVHFKMIETQIIKNAQGTTRVVTEIEYWALDNKYFRVDTNTVESNEEERIGVRRRMVLSPDGHVCLRSNPPNEALAITDWGSFEEGWDLFGGQFFVHAAARQFGIGPAETMFGRIVAAEVGILGLEKMPIEELEKLPIERDILKITLSPDGSQLEIQSRRQSDPNELGPTLTCDVVQGVVFRYRSRSFVDGVFAFSTQSDKDYDFARFGCIPARQIDRVTKASGSGWSYVYTTQRVDWEPVPLGIFSLEAQGLRPDTPKSVCSRRMAMMLIGFVCLGTNLAVNRIRKHGAE